jgi:hypothetical protein
MKRTTIRKQHWAAARDNLFDFCEIIWILSERDNSDIEDDSFWLDWRSCDTKFILYYSGSLSSSPFMMIIIKKSTICCWWWERKNVWQTWILKLTINKNFYLECHLISLQSAALHFAISHVHPNKFLQLAAISVHSPMDILLLYVCVFISRTRKTLKMQQHLSPSRLDLTRCVQGDKHEAIDCTIRVFSLLFSWFSRFMCMPLLSSNVDVK